MGDTVTEPEHCVPLCPKCNDYHERLVGKNDPHYMPTCTAHRSFGRGPCKNFPIRGGNVCAQTHNGRNEKVRDNARHNLEQEEAERRMTKTLVNMNPESELAANPLAGILWEVALSAQAVEWYAERIAELETPTLDGVPTTVDEILNEAHLDRMGRPIRPPQERDQLWGHDHDGDQAMHILLALYNEERDRHVRNCEKAIKAGVAERMVALAQNQGTMIARAFNGLIEAMSAEFSLDSSQRERARQISANILRALPKVENVMSVPTTA
jgi:hypothetical protein